MPPDLTLAELAALADVASRTIRYYIAQGLLPPPGREGPGTRYPASTLHRLRLIRQLQRGHLPLAEIRHRLDALSDEELAELAEAAPAEAPADSALDYVRSVLGVANAPLLRGSDALLSPPPDAPTRAAPLFQAALRAFPASPIKPVPAPTATERSQWERIVIEPDVELHIRRPSSRLANKRIERLIAFARQLLEEDQP